MTDHDQFATEFTAYGDALDVDRLLASTRTPDQFLVRRVGQQTEFGAEPGSGLACSVFKGGSRDSLVAAIRSFLTSEASLLRVLQAGQAGQARAELTATVFVRSPGVPLGLSLPSDLLLDLGRAGIAWSVLSVPCDQHGAVAPLGPS